METAHACAVGSRVSKNTSSMEDGYQRVCVARGGLPEEPTCKVTVVGTGAVGVAASYAMLMKGFGKPLVLIDIFENKVNGEVKDFHHALPFTDSEDVIGGSDYSLTAGSKVCIITAGARQSPGQSRLDLLEKNIFIIKNIITQLMNYSPEAYFIIATNPVDVLTYATWKLTGLPLNRIIGTGTNLDSARFRSYISKLVGVSVHNIDGYIIGEHGESSVPVWSQVRIAGQSFQQFEDLFTSDNMASIHQSVVDSAEELIQLKGYTSSGIGLAIADIVESILFDKKKVLCVSTLVKEFYDVETETFASLPCVLGANGIAFVVAPNLNDEERTKFLESVNRLTKSQNEIEHLLSE